jgi:hypothetical protein
MVIIRPEKIAERLKAEFKGVRKEVKRIEFI